MSLYSTKVNLDAFDVAKVIGRGAFSKVYLIHKYNLDNTECKSYALKVIKEEKMNP